MTATTGLDWVLSGFTDRVAGVRHAVAVSGDGLLVAASNELPPERADQLAAMVAGVVSLAQGVSAATDAGPVLRTIVQMGRSLLFVMALGDGHTLASIAAMVQPGCDVGEVAFEMSGLVDQVGAALTPSSR
ncbi:roadblock/LC7 domain-containing protein [Dactylosporangium sp. NPDC000521]|uniref:roadblock/LC7 domain-containing protein n=1 Tax=Dactylosporangium sp. NPDC000521 TaxID=3363975 RepID=UPI0036C4B189